MLFSEDKLETFRLIYLTMYVNQSFNYFFIWLLLRIMHETTKHYSQCLQFFLNRYSDNNNEKYKTFPYIHIDIFYNNGNSGTFSFKERLILFVQIMYIHRQNYSKQKMWILFYWNNLLLQLFFNILIFSLNI